MANTARPQQPRQPQKKPPNVGGGIGVVIIAIIAIIWFVSSHHGGGAKYKASVVSYSVINPADLGVIVAVTNDGSKAGTPTCMINASDPGGAYTGFDSVTLEGTLAAGATTHFSDNFVITHQGAQYVTQVTVSCS